ncbi:MAG: hypothetical protein V1789_00745 [PVC group bacterium]
MIEDRDKKSRVEVKLIRNSKRKESEHGDVPENNESEDWLVLCKSEGRHQKEQAIRSRAEERFLTDLEKLALRVKEGRLKDPVKIQRAIGVHY